MLIVIAVSQTTRANLPDGIHTVNLWTITIGEPLPGFSGTSRAWRGGTLSSLMADRGHDVTWWTSSVDHFNKLHWVRTSERCQLGPNLTLHFLHGRLYRRNVSLARYRNHREIAAEFTRIAPTLPRPDLVLCSFPPIELSAAAVQYGLRARVPVVLDIRDLWPDEILTRVPAISRPLARLLLHPLYQATRAAMRDAHAIIAISAAYLAWGLQMADRQQTDTDQIIPLGYTGNLDACQSVLDAERKLRAVGVDPNKRIFWFSGTFVGNIDLGTVIEAARMLKARTDIQFVFSGTGERESKWRTQAADLDNVIFTGWIGSDGLAWLSRVSWAGLGAYRRGATMSLPNKIFEYMSMGVPILSSLQGEAQDLVQANCLGDIYPAGDATALAALVERRALDGQWREDCSTRGRQLFRTSYSQEITYGRYAECLERLAATHAQL